MTADGNHVASGGDIVGAGPTSVAAEGHPDAADWGVVQAGFLSVTARVDPAVTGDNIQAKLLSATASVDHVAGGDIVQAGPLTVAADVNRAAAAGGDMVQAGSFPVPAEAEVNPVAAGGKDAAPLQSDEDDVAALSWPGNDVAAFSSPREDVAVVSSLGEGAAAFASPGKGDDGGPDAWMAPSSYMAVPFRPKAVVLAEGKPEENESQAPFFLATNGMDKPEKAENQATFLQPSHDVENLERSPLAKDFLGRSERDRKTGTPSMTTETLLLATTDGPIDPVTATTTTPGVSENLPARPEPDKHLGGKGESEEPSTTPSAPGSDVSIENAGPVTTPFDPARDRFMALVNAARSKERVPIVQLSETERRPVAAEPPSSTPSNSSVVAVDSAIPNRDRSMDLNNAATSDEMGSAATSAKTQGLPVAPEHLVYAPENPGFVPPDSAIAVDP